MNDIALPTPVKPAGLLESAMRKLFTRSAHVEDIEDIGPALRILTLAGEGLCDAAWTPGDKVQVQFGGWVQRTYTPMDWDSDDGRLRILVYLHASGGPGVQWARSVRRGDACVLFGPRKSVRLARPQPPLILFGDETSLGLAAALSQRLSPLAVQSLFEVSSLPDVKRGIEALSLQDVHLCRRQGGDGHFAELEARMSALLQSHPAADVVLTGRAGSIQHMTRLLRQRGVEAGRREVKAYWAPGKTGMD